jgi:hypothetical protein
MGDRAMDGKEGNFSLPALFQEGSPALCGQKRKVKKTR